MMTEHKIWPIKGGVHPDFNKDCSTQTPITKATLPDTIVIPVAQHIGEIGHIIVDVGQTIHKGQPLTDLPEGLGVITHASTSGTIIAIEERDVPHSSGLQATCVVIDVDGKDDWGEFKRDPILDYDQTDTMHLCGRIRRSGLVGMGGAAFPFAAKLAATREGAVKTLIINGVECEPYISCDDMLMRTYADEIIQGIKILLYILKPEECLIGIEDNKPLAIEALQKAQQDLDVAVDIVSIPTIYPSGDEKQLIRILTGKKLKKTDLTFDHGILMHNVATVRSVFRAVIHGEPLISRIVTVTGRGISKPQNFEAPIGTPIEHLVKLAGGYTDQAERLLIGGPMMGFPVKSDALPIIKAMNCILVAPTQDLPYSMDMAMPCIRCGQCADACPVDLLPQQLYWHAKAREFDKTETYQLFDCIECGCCAYVCPSDIPLVAHYRFAKSEIRNERDKQKKIDLARERFDFHEFRKERDKRERDEKRAKHKAALQKKKASGSNDKQAAIKAAMERAKAKKTQQTNAPKNTDNLTPAQQKQIDEAEQRRQQKPRDTE
ncbi:MAG: Electron transport complex protein RnfC [uncultured Thiotrichaceae bacterium]|uniref:Ion-translocating oxidoreductase complex subunit C n=1 Tax=uncultured Thiotrichaceae bacterium TaxID=298394 RepID=A0A6S6TXI1_9GAMM|nr:MAG: Electron transport complex protein RnfC [uncultured Thiotrichaceae bacterium]